ncbi:MAG: ferredoxin [Candidatus Magasanikbacteria bacterium RIFOXYA2_FULL_44_8]|uniref:Ferredoxin n=1 Tax=Candidatus Magasanikbacteria bacterium RIFOXYA2_FULL_44_8 TaxID=1798696 RepID=A0A1F6NI31_9BACT|nr:MAG: ferredoxin [Candidatus Magasanikbacteria bacterium RIFOXYA2_FULL_44_8]
MKKPVIDREKCIGCGTCPALCPNVFKMDDEGKAIVHNPTGDTEENIQMAADSCPVTAITLE